MEELRRKGNTNEVNDLMQIDESKASSESASLSTSAPESVLGKRVALTRQEIEKKAKAGGAKGG